MGLIEVQVPGYGRAEGADENFPYNAAAVVNNWAHLAQKVIVSEVIEQIKNCLGNPNKITDIATVWSSDAGSLINDARQGMLSTRLNLAAYWSGSAFESFNSYVEHVEEIIDHTYTVMKNMGGLVGELRAIVDSTYMSGIQFIGTCATEILQAAGSAAQNWMSLWGAVCGAILDALAAFTGATTDLLQSAIQTLGDYAQTGQALISQADDIRIPDALPSNATPSENWTVNPR
ncbi:hypothetical protein [Actinoalloteichus hymeniacidonis]|uniref:WXG repeat protein n=1 Tax=Actinoalloteichus hymeniacidonis TaxID=340345 RepID=A0AAC9HRR4_9PSEU|nr:hypothetical protein [Actinoalloteichus hymeniacidonis]AOS64195.1 hypothetical protein TL08_16975 [Actinoalloteichus hymeniacidonis]MBB5907737.1 uncharacterized protein YukE [Actinoalloteichus hymeniacidonis]